MSKHRGPRRKRTSTGDSLSDLMQENTLQDPPPSASGLVPLPPVPTSTPPPHFQPAKPTAGAPEWPETYSVGEASYGDTSYGGASHGGASYGGTSYGGTSYGSASYGDTSYDSWAETAYQAPKIGYTPLPKIPQDAGSSSISYNPLPKVPQDLDIGPAGYTPLPKVPQDVDSGFKHYSPLPKIPQDLDIDPANYAPLPKVPKDLDSGFAGYTPLPKVPQDLDSGFISHAPVPKLPPDLQRFLTGYDPAPVHGDVQGHFVEAQPTRELDENSSLPFPHGTSLGGELKELHDELDKFQSYPSLRFDPQPWKWENWEPAAQRGAMKIGLKLGMPREWSKYGNLCTDDEKMAVDTQRKALYAMLADMRKKWGKAAREEKRVGKGNERKDKILEAKAIIAELDKTGRSRRDLSKLSSDQKKILFWYEKCKKLDDDFDKGV